MNLRQLLKRFVIPLTITGIVWPTLGIAQVTCIYPPPQNGDEIFALMQRKISGMRWQTPELALYPAQRPEGAWRALAVLIDFPDYRWHTTSDSNFANPDSVYSPQHFQAMLFSQGVYADPFSASSYTGSLRDFYLENSYGRFAMDGDIAGWFTAPHEMKYYVNQDGVAGTSDDFGYGAYPHNAQRLVEDAIALADPSVDFSRYDNNHDGVVDALFIVHAAPGAEAVISINRAVHYNYMWSHFGAIRSLRIDNVEVSSYAFVPEDGAVGVFCHEFGHALGLPDLYDTDRSSEGIGEWCLMGSGSWCFKSGDRLGTSPSYFSAWSRLRLGWATPLTFNENEMIRLAPVVTSDNILVLQNSSMPAGEYFLLENRQPLGFDAGLTRRQKDFNLPAPAGLMIYHVDEAAGSTSFDRRRLVDVEEASPYVNGGQAFEQLDKRREPPNHVYLNRGNRGDNGDPFPGFAAWTDDLRDFLGPASRDRFDDFSTPASRANGGAPTGIAVREIQLDGIDVLCRVQLQNMTAVATDNSSVPRALSLQAHPNPAHHSFRLRGRLPEAVGNVTARLFDLLGRELATRHFSTAADGRFEWIWNDLDSMPPGIYFAVIEARHFRAATKILFLR